ncbi:hypothetical protein BBP40_008647 [Aspergillus hancockii]|nr:hypothetical protein BBP40_008647 [Aspergillus hancockii]
MVAEYEQVDELVEKFHDLIPCSSATVDPTEPLAMPMWLSESWQPLLWVPLFNLLLQPQYLMAIRWSVHRATASSFRSGLNGDLSLFGTHTLLVTLSSIYDVPPEPYSVGDPLAPVALAEEPELIPVNSAAPASGLLPTWFPAILSPLPEEIKSPQDSGLSSGPCCSSAGTGQVEATETSAPILAAERRPSALLKTPSKTLFVQHRKSKARKLTKSTVNRKRAHEETSDEDRSGPVTPAANKRRNLGPPGSTPFANRRTLSRRLSSRAAPLSSRLARREAEQQGRIESTLFRIPDYLRQLEADRQKSGAASSSASPQPPQANFHFTVEPALPMDPSSANEAPQESSTPERNTSETPQRGWNIRGLLSSVPRSFSRLLPFGRSSERSEVRSTFEPSSERIVRTRPYDTAPADSRNEPQSRRRLSEQPTQPPKKRARNLSYSLFPAPIDRSLYLGDISKPSTVLPESSTSTSRSSAQETAKKVVAQKTAISDNQTRGREVSPETVSETVQKKRKRSPSPDVIPNPVGASYGMDLDYFCYSSESDDEVTATPAKQSEPKKADGLAKTSARSALRSERQSCKKVRFDASPEDTPSKLRTRARSTDPYHGTHFIGMGSTSAPATPTPAARDDQPQRYPGFIPNTQGTFQLDYDAFSDDSDSSGPSSQTSILAPSSVPTEEEARASTQPEDLDVASRQAPKAHLFTPSKVDGDALARVRSQAEKYKPKTPSGLRTASRYSSPMTATPETISSKPPTSVKSDEPAQSKQAEESAAFGDDEFARDAEWLYQNCPSGDLSQLKWPARQSYEESVGVSSRIIELLASIWDDSEVDTAYVAFRRSFEEYKMTLE